MKQKIFFITYFIIAFLWRWIIIFSTTIIFNSFYYIKYFLLSKLIGAKQKLINTINNDVVQYPQQATSLLHKLMPDYKYDLAYGIINWFAQPAITYLRCKHNDNKHSIDCSDYAIMLKLILKLKLKHLYKNITKCILLSYDKLVVNNHTIIIAKRAEDGKLDVYSPYIYVGVFKNMNNVRRFFEKVFGCKYLPFYLF